MNKEALAYISALEEEIRQREELIIHCWVYSGYQNCGFMKMTTKQKRLYDILTSKPVDQDKEGL